MKITKLILCGMLSALFLNSCSNDDEINEPEVILPEGDYTNGFFVLNEGNFGKNNSSLSFIENDFTNPRNDVFYSENGVSLGDTGQSLSFDGDYAYVVLNASNSIEIFNRYTLETIATIEEGLHNPRYIAFANGNLYVTNWGDGTNPNDDYIAIYSIENYEAAGTISIAEGPEKIISDNNKLYVALQGGYSFNNKVAIINLISNAVESSVEVGDVPNSLQIEDGYLWVMSGGIPAWPQDIDETAGKISKIDLSTNEVIAEMKFLNSTDHPGNFEIENNNAYYTLNGAVYSFEKSSTALPTESIFNLNNEMSLYGFDVKDEYIYTGDAKDFNSNGMVRIYNLKGDLIKEYEVGVGPNGFYFNN